MRRHTRGPDTCGRAEESDDRTERTGRRRARVLTGADRGDAGAQRPRDARGRGREARVSYSVAEAIKVAKSQVGKRETGTNDTPYNRWLGKIPGYPHSGYGYPWCQSFQSWVASQAGGKANTHYPKTAGCAVAVS